jgi:peptidyl-prolyl cis-trans isomerase C
MNIGNLPSVLRAGLREPLVHFLGLGLAIFLFSTWRGETADPESRTIRIGAAQVERLAAGWSQVWQRPPTTAEIDALIKDHIKEEVYYREAKRLGLDEDDAVIRRRLRAKMEFLAGAEVDSAQPDDAVLQRWIDRAPARYAADPSYSIDQIYLGQLDPDAAADAARAAKNAVAAGRDWRALGQPISLPRALEAEDRTAIARQFGDGFAGALTSLETGAWTGPIASGFGQHLVRVRQVRVAAKPLLADVRREVENDWRAATRENREAAAYQLLLDSYSIRIDRP